jgi:hypothetical protein
MPDERYEWLETLKLNREEEHFIQTRQREEVATLLRNGLKLNTSRTTVRVGYGKMV